MQQIQQDYTKASLDPPTRLLLQFAEKVTRTPAQIEQEDIVALREGGFRDEDILESVHIIGYFNHINRVSEALGVDLEDFMVESEEGQASSQ